jgi:hypothetical protein
MRITLTLIALLALAGCSRSPVRTITVHDTKYVTAPVSPALLTARCTFYEPDPTAMRDGEKVFSTGQLGVMRLGYQQAQDCFLSQLKAIKAQQPAAPKP